MNRGVNECHVLGTLLKRETRPTLDRPTVLREDGQFRCQPASPSPLTSSSGRYTPPYLSL
jgi:hypothetical protein